MIPLRTARSVALLAVVSLLGLILAVLGPAGSANAAPDFRSRVHPEPENGPRFAGELADAVHACVPFAPDSNLVCLALNPAGNHDVAAASAFVRRVHDELRSDPARPLQAKDFFGSITTLRADAMGADELGRIAARLGLDATGLAEQRLVILRHTLMNPYLLDAQNGISYIDRYFDFLGARLRELLGKDAHAA